MGRYLAIGITTNLALQKKKAENAFESIQNAIKYVEDNYAPLDIYDRTENEEYVMFKIKKTLLETELIDFLGDFYAARMSFNGKSGECDSLISTLKEAHTAEEIMSLAADKRWEHFQKDSYWEAICIRDELWHRVYLEREGIDLSLDGKILMECYGGLFKFFTSLVQEKFNKYSLSKALRVTIMG